MGRTLPARMPAPLARDAFALPAPPAVDLRAFTHGAMPQTVPAMLQAFADDWAAHGVDAWNAVPDHWRTGADKPFGWWALPEVLGDAFIAPLLGAPAGTCVMQPSAHAVVQAVLSSPEVWARGRRVVTTAAEFPSVLHSVQKWRSVHGYSLAVVPAGPDGFVDRAALLREASVPGTALTIVSHVGFATGERLGDGFLADLADATHRAGGLLALDGYHATGSLRTDVRALGCDLYFAGLLKEGCGSSGSAFVYVRDGLDLTPVVGGWFGDADPFGFAPEPVPHPVIRRRFLGGTTPVASLYHAVEGLRVLLGLGMDPVEAHVRALTGEAGEAARRLGLRLVSPTDEAARSALVVLAVDDADRLAAHLKAEGVLTDARRGTLLRLAPFVWNGSDDVARAFSVLGHALRTGAHRTAVLDRSGPVT